MNTTAIRAASVVAAESPAPAHRGPARFARRLARASFLIFAVAGLLFGTAYAWRCREFRTHLAEARRATLEGRTSAALSHLRICDAIDPDDRSALLLSARVHRMAQDGTRAEEALEHYWIVYGDDDDLAFERLLLRASLTETDPVAPLLASRISGGGERGRLARHALASGYIREFRYAAAQTAIEAWRSESPSDPLAEMLRGRLEEQLFRYQDAAETYGGIVERHPEHHEARLRLALMLTQQRRADAALAHLAVLRKALPGSAEVAVQWALALRQAGRTDEAARALDEALEEFPRSADALTERGTLALNAGDDLVAAESFDRALRIEPGAIGTRSLYVQALTRLGRTAEAESERKRIAALSADSDRLTELIQGPLLGRPNDPAPAFEMGGIALRAGQPTAAIRWYQEALKRDPNHAPSHTALAVIHQEMGNPVMATKHRALASAGGRR